MAENRASEMEGWAVRVKTYGGESFLNHYSLGDVVVYTTEKEALEEADSLREIRGYRDVSVEKVEKGAWEPSRYEKLFLDSIECLEGLAFNGDEKAKKVISRMRRLLSPYAPAHLREG